jgi:hypothetical protein
MYYHYCNTWLSSFGEPSAIGHAAFHSIIIFVIFKRFSARETPSSGVSFPGKHKCLARFRNGHFRQQNIRISEKSLISAIS